MEKLEQASQVNLENDSLGRWDEAEEEQMIMINKYTNK